MKYGKSPEPYFAFGMFCGFLNEIVILLTRPRSVFLHAWTLGWMTIALVCWIGYRTQQRRVRRRLDDQR